MKHFYKILSPPFYLQRRLKEIYFFTGCLFFMNSALAQDVSLSGKVTQEEGSSLPGVSIVIKGTSNGTITDINGNYRLTVPVNATLVFSYVGYVTEEILVNNRSKINVTLVPDISTLDEVVVVGYETVRKRDLTGSVSSIDVEELVKNPGTSVEHQLQGLIPGVNVRTSGAPGGGAQVRIRGFGTIGDNNPLYIIDGVPSANGVGLNAINPNAIASISVMKDASAASIYGSRAANGVVVITTRKGERGQKARISYDSYLSIDTDPGKIDVLNAGQWGEMEWRGQTAAGLTPSHPTYGNGPSPEIPAYINGDPSQPYDPVTNKIMRAADTDWFDELTQTGFRQNHNLSISGGGEGSRYYVAFGSLRQKGTQIHTNYNRYTTRLNTEFFALNDRLRIGENISIAYSERLGAPGGRAQRYTYHPLIPVFDEGGNFGGTLGGTLGLQTNARNPVAMQIRSKENVQRLFRTFGNIYAEIDIIPDLVFKTNAGIDYRQSNNTSFSPRSPERGNLRNSLAEFSGWSSSLTWTNTINYARNFGEHSVGVLLGAEAIQLKSQNQNVTGNDFFVEDRAYTFLNSAGEILNSTGIGSQRNLSSYFGKIDYAFRDKYLINATLRRDGSSALATGNKYDVFPAAGMAWVLSEEGFLKKSTLIDFLKIRIGWGQTGNQNSLSDFAYNSVFAQYPPASVAYDINAANNNFETGIALLSRGNEDLIWETSETVNVGLDFALLDNRISGSFEWYEKNTHGLLLRSPVPLTAGIAAPPFINIGKIQNKGVDVKLGYNGNIGPLALGLTGIVSAYKNKVLSLDGNPETFINGPGGNPNIIPSRTQAGHPIAMFYGLLVDGVVQQGDNAGNFDFRDISGDGTIDPNEDNTFIGNPHPDFTYSLNINAAWKNFDFTAFFRGSQGNDIWQWRKINTDFQFRSGVNRSTRVLNAWRPDNPTNALAEYNVATANYNLQASSYYVEDGSYLRLQTLQLGYTFPTIAFLENLRVYLQGQNLLTITNYSGLDPEILDGGLEKGVDRGGTYAVPRSFLLGFNISF